MSAPVLKLHSLDASLSWISAERTLSNCSPLLLCLYLTHFQQCISTEGPCGGPERGHPGSPRLCSTEASVSHSAHNTSLLRLQLAAPRPRKSQNRLCVHPPRAHMLEVRLGRGRGANAGFRSDYSYSLAISALLLFFSRLPLPKRGAPASWSEYCKHMCVTYV